MEWTFNDSKTNTVVYNCKKKKHDQKCKRTNIDLQ